MSQQQHNLLVKGAKHKQQNLTSFCVASSSFGPDVLHQQQVQFGGAWELGGVAKTPQLVIIACCQHLGAAVHG